MWQVDVEISLPITLNKELIMKVIPRHFKSLIHPIVLIALLVSILGSAVFITPAHAASFTVTKTADTNDGVCDADCSLREAISATNASPGADTITIPGGTYQLTLLNAGGTNEDNNATGDLDVLDSLTINGAGSGSTIIQAGTNTSNGIDKVIAANPFCTSGVNVAIDGVTVRFGRNTQPSGAADYSFTGGGIDYCAGGSGETFTLSNSVITSNTNLNGYGGGLNFDSFPGTFTANITNVTFSNNQTLSTTQTANGGAINLFGDSLTINITNSTFTGNHTTNPTSGGGAIYFRPTTVGHLSISGSTFTNNIAAGIGGALATDSHGAGSTISIQNSIFTGNTATNSFGGALDLDGTDINTTPFSLTHLTITGNTAGISGGGIYVGHSNVTMSKSLIVGNSASTGKGIHKSVDAAVATVTNNWWGCSTGPGAAPCDTATTSGVTLNFTPWYRNQLTAATSPIATNQSTSLTTSFLTNSSNAAVPLADLAEIINRPIIWAATNGNLSGTQGTVQAAGTAAGSFQATAAGTAVISAKVDNDNTAPTSSNVLSLPVNKANTTAAITNAVTISSTPSVTGEPVAVTFSVTGAFGNSPTAPTGNVTVSDGTDSCTGTVAAGTCNLIFKTAGTKTLTATYEGDANFNVSPASASAAHTVNKADTTTTIDSFSPVSPSVIGQPVTVNFTVAPVAPGALVSPTTFTGSVTISDGTNTCTDTTVPTGTGSCTITFTSVGLKTLTATYNAILDDANFNGSTSNSASYIVNKADTSTSVVPNANPSVIGQFVTFTATVNVTAPGAGAPTGSVEFFDGATSLGTVTLSGATATLTTSTLTAGAHTVKANYLGDLSFNTSFGNVSQTVNKADTSTALALTAGTNPSTYGDSLTFTASVNVSAPGSGTPTGTVEFFNGATSLGTGTLNGSGQATFTSSTLATGSYSLTATYNGDSSFNISTSAPALAHTINKASTTTAVTSNINPSVFGQAVTFTATVNSSAGTPTGTVEFFDGVTSLGTGTLNGSGKTTLSTSALAVGAHNIMAVYGADTNFSGSASSLLTQNINQASTTTSVVSSSNPSVMGESVTFTATVTAVTPGAGAPTGTVGFFDGATNLGSGTLNGSGQATFSMSALGIGAHPITAVYAGNSSFATSTSGTLNQSVGTASTGTTLISNNNPSLVGQSVTFTATVSVTPPGSGTPTGTVTFFNGATNIGTGTLNGSGQATLTMSALLAGTHSITAVYSGDSSYSTSTSAALSQQVNKTGTTSSITADINPSVFGESVMFTATVASVTSGTPTGTVEFFNGATNLGTVTLDSSGQATLSTSTLSVATHSITVVYAGDANFDASTSSVLSQVINQAATTTGLASSANPSTYGQSVTFTATVNVVAPGAGAPTGTVEFFDGATSLGTGTLNGSGQATFSTSALDVAGSPHSITATYNGDAHFSSSTSSAVSQVVQQATTSTSLASSANPSVFGQSVTFTATVSSSTGTPTGTVEFFDGATSLGTATLDGSGQATLTTSILSVTSHSITATYAGSTNYAGSTSSTLTQVVNKANTSTTLVSNTNPSLVGQSVTFTATVAAVAPGVGTPTGTVEFFDGAASLGTGTLDGSGQATLTTTTLLFGSHNITAVYAASVNFKTSTSSILIQDVQRADTTTAITSDTPDPSLAGAAFTVKFTVTPATSGTPTGNVTVSDGVNSCVGTVASGSCSLTLNTLGARSLTATYAGDANFNSSVSAAEAHTVDQAPAFTSTTSVTFTVGNVESFTIQTSGYPTATITFTSTPALPGSISLLDNGDGTATLSGTPVAGDSAVYSISLTTSNGIGVDATQTLTLTINEAPSITSSNNTTFVAGTLGSFVVTTTGSPTPTISKSGALPGGVSFVDQGNGTAILSGTPIAGSAGTYPINLTAFNGVGSSATQSFTLTVDGPTAVTKINSLSDTGDGQVDENEHTAVNVTQLLVVFNKAMNAADAVTLANYSLVQGTATPVAIDSASYDGLTQTVTLGINGGAALLEGKYTLTIKGDIRDSNGYALGADFVRVFYIDKTEIKIITNGVTLPDNTVIVDGATLNSPVSEIWVTFNEDAANPAGNTDMDDVTNPANYVLVRPGLNAIFDTISCLAGVDPNDVAVPTGPVTYDNGGGSGPFVAKIRVNNGTRLENGIYRLFVCGTTSITDLAGNALNNGADQQLSFTVLVTSSGGGSKGHGKKLSNPATGFEPGVLTALPWQPAEKTYTDLGNLWIEVPSLKIKTSITGVPLSEQGWDLTWLNRQVGWLEGTAYPTWQGNTVLTAHNYTADGKAGPFALLQNLKYGETIVIHFGGLKYTYAIRANLSVAADDTYWLTKHEKLDWITLITCQQYDEVTKSYRQRRVVRAVLLNIEKE
jgi:LPXTG-site transpeptidase (sortase) family protein